MVYWIDDEPEILEIVECFLGEKVTVCNSWEECNPKWGDLVIHDINGVGMMKQVPGVRYLSCSGSLEIIPDIQKPINFDLLDKLVAA